MSTLTKQESDIDENQESFRDKDQLSSFTSMTLALNQNLGPETLNSIIKNLDMQYQQINDSQQQEMNTMTVDSMFASNYDEKANLNRETGKISMSALNTALGVIASPSKKKGQTKKKKQSKNADQSEASKLQ